MNELHFDFGIIFVPLLLEHGQHLGEARTFTCQFLLEARPGKPFTFAGALGASFRYPLRDLLLARPWCALPARDLLLWPLLCRSRGPKVQYNFLILLDNALDFG